MICWLIGAIDCYDYCSDGFGCGLFCCYCLVFGCYVLVAWLVIAPCGWVACSFVILVLFAVLCLHLVSLVGLAGWSGEFGLVFMFGIWFTSLRCWFARVVMLLVGLWWMWWFWLL